MPELPEVETVVRTLEPRLTGRRIVEARFCSSLVLRGAPDPPVAGRQVLGVRRRGKNILIELEGGCLAIHLGMTGKLLADPPETGHVRAVFRLDDGVLVYDDIRQFGRILWCRNADQELEKLGPDPLSLSREEFVEMVRGRRGRIKPLLLNQAFLSGMGNIYTDEALFRAKVHPLAQASRLSVRRAGELHEAIIGVLTMAIEMGGSSISDYLDAEGRRGSYQEHHQVYGKEGEPCPRCLAPLRRIVVVQRGTHYCAKCQRA